MVLLPPSRVGVAVRVVAAGIVMVVVDDIVLKKHKGSTDP
jgi:hypothetical protein